MVANETVITYADLFQLIAEQQDEVSQLLAQFHLQMVTGARDQAIVQRDESALSILVIIALGLKNGQSIETIKQSLKIFSGLDEVDLNPYLHQLLKDPNQVTAVLEAILGPTPMATPIEATDSSAIPEVPPPVLEAADFSGGEKTPASGEKEKRHYRKKEHRPFSEVEDELIARWEIASTRTLRSNPEIQVISRRAVKKLFFFIGETELTRQLKKYYPTIAQAEFSSDEVTPVEGERFHPLQKFILLFVVKNFLADVNPEKINQEYLSTFAADHDPRRIDPPPAQEVDPQLLNWLTAHEGIVNIDTDQLIRSDVLARLVNMAKASGQGFHSAQEVLDQVLRMNESQVDDIEGQQFIHYADLAELLSVLQSWELITIPEKVAPVTDDIVDLLKNQIQAHQMQRYEAQLLRWLTTVGKVCYFEGEGYYLRATTMMDTFTVIDHEVDQLIEASKWLADKINTAPPKVRESMKVENGFGLNEITRTKKSLHGILIPISLALQWMKERADQGGFSVPE